MLSKLWKRFFGRSNDTSFTQLNLISPPNHARNPNVVEADKSVQEQLKEYNDIMSLLSKQERYKDACLYASLSVSLARQHFGERDPRFIGALNSLGMLNHLAGDYDSAEPLLKQVMEIKRELYGEQDPAFAHSFETLAS